MMTEPLVIWQKMAVKTRCTSLYLNLLEKLFMGKDSQTLCLTVPCSAAELGLTFTQRSPLYVQNQVGTISPSS